MSGIANIDLASVWSVVGDWCTWWDEDGRCWRSRGLNGGGGGGCMYGEGDEQVQGE